MTRLITRTINISSLHTRQPWNTTSIQHNHHLKQWRNWNPTQITPVFSSNFTLHQKRLYNTSSNDDDDGYNNNYNNNNVGDKEKEFKNQGIVKGDTVEVKPGQKTGDETYDAVLDSLKSSEVEMDDAFASFIAKQQFEEHDDDDPNEESRFVNVYNAETGEWGGQKGVEPTRYGDWEKKGRVTDF
eukprot:gb/GECH01013943.1/.p1 GENE.gb/GECH01013943.1/~~gb/GECH01013943.1/.p1  ORF type:complete len:185 (+),score=47.73 gb/GECH01013943.1/:1-555(+)